MKRLVLLFALLVTPATAVRAQDAIPDLKGMWSGKGKSIVFGSNAYHPGTQATTDAPRIRGIEATHTVEGQDGRLAWGHSSSTVADTKDGSSSAEVSGAKVLPSNSKL
jgi:hypothetical protein